MITAKEAVKLRKEVMELDHNKMVTLLEAIYKSIRSVALDHNVPEKVEYEFDSTVNHATKEMIVEELSSQGFTARLKSRFTSDDAVIRYSYPGIVITWGLQAGKTIDDEQE